MRSLRWVVLAACGAVACPAPVPVDDGGSQAGGAAMGGGVATGGGTATAGGTSQADDAGARARVTIGGLVDGLDLRFGSLALVLGTEALTVSANGSFVFAGLVDEGSAWSVSLQRTPAEQRCELENASGIATRVPVDTVRVHCVTKTATLSGVASGVDRQGLSLRERVSQQVLLLPVDAGAFSFPTPLSYGAPFDVAIDTLPLGRVCGLDGGAGVVNGTEGLELSCALRREPLSVELVGVDVGQVLITEVVSNQSFTPQAGADAGRFLAPLPWDAPFDVRVVAPAGSGRTCVVDGGVGVVQGPLPSPVVSCVKQRFDVGGTVSGLDAGLVVLREQTTAQQVTIGAQATSFRLPNQVEWDTPLSLVVATQPATRFCVLDGGTRVVRSNVTDVALSCRGGFDVSGRVVNLRGPGLALVELGTGQSLSFTPDGGTVGFRLPFVVPEGAPLQLSLTQPIGQTCRLEAPAGPVSGPVSVLLTCGVATNDLVINEVGAFPGPTMPFWVELYNGTTRPLPLAAYALRTASRVLADGGDGPIVDFQLPDASVPSGGYFVVSGKPIADLHDSPTLRFLLQGGLTPIPGSSLELWSADAGVDTVRFDGGAASMGWSGAGLLLPSSLTDFGRSLARTQTPDTNAAVDFEVCDYPTPAGLNDVCTSPDVDVDGLPDLAEVQGSTWNELPLFEWGARTAQRDVFVEVDWLTPTGFNGTFDPGVEPRREALERIEGVFRSHGVFVHFDTGPLFHPAPGLDPASFDLGGGNQQPWACTVTLSNVAGATSFYQLKANHADVRRRLAFHYALFASSLADVTCANSGAGVSGNSELNGNDLAIALGRAGLTLANQNGVNQTINWQAATLMHELGHNLGLRHGGFEDANFKPNYLSIMNYYYQNDGLPVIGMNEGDRYYRSYVLYGACSGAPGLTSATQLNRNRFSSPALFALDYSDGGSVALDEAALVESNGFGRAGSGSIDFNWNTVIDTAPVTANLNALNTLPRLCPRVSGGNEVLLDHDDWSALVLPFLRTARGSAHGAPLFLRRTVEERPLHTRDFFMDHQHVVDEQPLLRE